MLKRYYSFLQLRKSIHQRKFSTNSQAMPPALALALASTPTLALSLSNSSSLSCFADVDGGFHHTHYESCCRCWFPMVTLYSPGKLLELEEDKQLADLVKDWDFKKGRDFEDAIFANYRSSVHFPSSSPRGAFHLFVVFRRFTFRLTDVSVSMALHACLGGNAYWFSCLLSQRSPLPYLGGIQKCWLCCD
jgi:hypothetical protein